MRVRYGNEIAFSGRHAGRKKVRGAAPGPRQNALPPGPPPRAVALGSQFVSGNGVKEAFHGFSTTGQASFTPLPVPPCPYPLARMDRSQRASPFGGGPGGKASWRGLGQRPITPPSPPPTCAPTRTACPARISAGSSRPCRARSPVYDRAAAGSARPSPTTSAQARRDCENYCHET